MGWHCKTIKNTEQDLKTNLEKGLTNEEAEKRLKEYGKNEISKREKEKTIIVRFFQQLNDFLVIILIVAAAVSFEISFLRGEREFWDSAIIIAIVLVNAAIGVMQESKAQKAIEELKKLTPTHARVLRNGEVIEIEAVDIVPGDIMVFETGDQICADGRIIESISLKTEEAAITGEAMSVEKDLNFKGNDKTHIAERKNMVLSASFVAFGRGRAVVTATGMNTEVGKIAELLQQEKEKKTPLQEKLDETGKTLALGAIGICIIIFILGILRKEDIFSMFMTSVSLAVAAIPEGLTAVVTIVLAMGTKRLSQKKAIIRRLPAVETLGSAQVICTDKTGTLTKNKMKVVKIKDISGESNADEESSRNILMLSALCNDAVYKDRRFVGEATEAALAEAALEHGVFKTEAEFKMHRVMELPFSSDRKLMTTVHKAGEGYICVTKGAPEMLLERCTRVYINGKERKLEKEDKALAETICNTMASNALRVIAVGRAYFSYLPKENELEKNITLYGFTGIMDTPRPEARQAVLQCKKAGIKPIMVTGDNVLTAIAVGKAVGIFEDGDESITGIELNEMSQERLEKNIERYSVFARVTPEHKMRIVKAFQAKEKIVAMTGDGVNDAPALKAADIGCAMGKTGTDAAKNASDMIIADDNFATIVEAVREGRGIYENIKKTVHFLLSSNIGEIITIFSALVIGFETPLLPIQLLWVNLITDSLPAIALGLEKTEDSIIETPLKNSGKSIFSDGLGLRICIEGMMIGLLALIAFGIGHVYYDKGISTSIGRTMAFAVLSLSQLVHSFNMRSEASVVNGKIFENIHLNIAFVIGTAMQCIVISVPFFSSVFKVTPLYAQQWGIVWALAFVPLLVVEIEKRFVLKREIETKYCSQ